jgi:hypothetical protein
VTTEQPSSPAGRAGPTAGMGVAGFVSGLVGLGLSWVIPLVGIILGVLGIALGGVGISQGRRTGGPTGLAVAGVVLGALAVIVAILVVAAVVATTT